jgi:hypothetical protein
MADKNINIKINADDRASGTFARLGGSLKKLGVAMGAFVGGRAIVAGIKSTVSAFVEQENATEDLRSALAKTGDATEANMAKFQKLASTIQSLTTIEDDGLVTQIAYAKNLGVSTDKLEDVTTAAIGLSRKLKVDVNTAMMLLAKASVGNVAGLEKLGIRFLHGVSAGAKFNAVIKIGNSYFSQATDEANRTGGRIKQLANSFGDLKESIGGAIVTGTKLPEVLDEISLQLQAMQSSGVFAEMAQDIGITVEALKPLGVVIDGIIDSIAGLSAVIGKGTENTEIFVRKIAKGDLKGAWKTGTENVMQPFEEGQKAMNRRAQSRVDTSRQVEILRGEREAAKQKILASVNQAAGVSTATTATQTTPAAVQDLSGGATLADVVTAIENLKAE